MKYFQIALLTIYILILTTYNSYSQQKWIGAMPMNYVGAFAGSAGSARVASYTYGQTFNRYSNNIQNITNSTSFDTYITKLSTGIGISASYYNHYHSFLNAFSIPPSTAREFKYQYENYSTNLTIAPKISIKGKYTLSPALSARISNSVIHDSRDDQTKNITSLRYNASILFNTKRYYIGYSISPPKSTYDDTRLPIGHTLQTGMVFQRTDESNFSFTPTLILYSIFTIQRNNLNDDYQVRTSMSSMVNMNFRYKKILTGIGDQQFMAGIQLERFKIMTVYQHDLLNIIKTMDSNMRIVRTNRLNLAISLRYQINTNKNDLQVN